jgi:hypothetical protein
MAELPSGGGPRMSPQQSVLEAAFGSCVQPAGTGLPSTEGAGAWGAGI